MKSRTALRIAGIAVVAGVIAYRAFAPDAAHPAGDADARDTAALPADAAKVEPRRLGRLRFAPCSLASPLGGDSIDVAKRLD